MLELEQRLAAGRVDDALKSPLVDVGLARDQAALGELFVGSGKIGDVDLDMVAVVGRNVSYNFV